MEYITLKIPRTDFDFINDNGLFTEMEIKEVSVKDNFFEGDPHHERLKKDSIKAYKNLKEYEFRKRHNIV